MFGRGHLVSRSVAHRRLVRQQEDERADLAPALPASVRRVAADSSPVLVCASSRLSCVVLSISAVLITTSSQGDLNDEAIHLDAGNKTLERHGTQLNCH